MNNGAYVVHTAWDDEAKVWVAQSEDVPGLVTEAENLDALMEKLRVMVPELLDLNGALPKDDSLPIEVIATLQELIRLQA